MSEQLIMKLGMLCHLRPSERHASQILAASGIVDAVTGLDSVEKREIPCFSPELNPNSLVQLAASNCTD
jgi:hypothetical protein